MASSFKNLQSLLNLEKSRTRLAKSKNYQQLLKTYSDTTLKRNGNTAKFWDNKFAAVSEQGIESTGVEKDRNQTAYNWLKALLRPEMKVLNVGCGDGKFETFLSPQDMAEIHYEGVDFAPQSISQLQKKFSYLDFWVGDILTAKLKSKYQIICAFEILEHISSFQVLAVLKKLYRALTIGGYLMVAVPTNEPLVEMFPANPNEHVRAYSREVICAELELSGFSILKVAEFSAFASHYFLKKILSRTILKNHWLPNDILVLAQKN
jgi:ubiquinone/menaquinone biosynthesis C-methylase UbiE